MKDEYEPTHENDEGDDGYCHTCDGEGVCLYCWGKGCGECDDTGDCPVCDGFGY